MTNCASYVKRLTVNDIPEIKRLFNSHSHVMKIPVTDEYRNLHFSDMDTYIDKSDLVVFWGAFSEQHVLCSYLVQEFSLLRPSWYLKLLVTDISYSNRPLSMRHSGLGLCIDVALESAEKAEYFEWLYSVVLDRFNTRAKIWTTQSKQVSRYEFYIESVFAPNEEAKFTYQKNLLTNRTRDRTWAIKKAILKREHRFEILNNLGKLDLTYKEAYNE